MGFKLTPPSAPSPSDVKDQAEQTAQDLMDAGEDAVDAITDAVTNAASQAPDPATPNAQPAITGFIAVYKTVMVGVKMSERLLDVIDGFAVALSHVTESAIDDAAAHLNEVLATALTGVIAMLTTLTPLGEAPSKTRRAIDKIRQAVDRAITWETGKVLQLLVHIRTALTQIEGHSHKQPQQRQDATVRTLEWLQAHMAQEHRTPLPRNRKSPEKTPAPRGLERLLAFDKRMKQLELAVIARGTQYKDIAATIAKARHELRRNHQALVWHIRKRELAATRAALAPRRP